MVGRFVLDASISLKWFFEERDSDLAEVLLEKVKNRQVKVFVPQIFFFEVVNAVKTKAKSTARDVAAVIEKIFSLKLASEKADKKFLMETNLYAQKYNLTIYDASYLALAKILKIDLITADESLKKKTKLKFIKSLKDCRD